MKNKTIRILGIRGVPAAHGGFETFAEYLAPFLVERGWTVIVYCQEEGEGEIYESDWRGVKRIHIPVHGNGAKSTIVFDWVSTLHASKSKDLCLTLGYNTALFATVLRFKGVPNVINMDGIEWRRAKWGLVAKTWFWINEWAGSLLSNHMVADHPQIKVHLARGAADSKITMIPYGAERLATFEPKILEQFGLNAGCYGILIARPEPENSVLEVVQAFSKQSRGMPLVILGNYKPQGNAYHAEVLAAASAEVKFVGAIYDRQVVNSLRVGARFYVHGHQVGGTNPSLVEALGAGNPVLAHDNRFNRWVAAESAVYFSSIDECHEQITRLCNDGALVQNLQQAAIAQYHSKFEWDAVLIQYEQLLLKWQQKD
ncbi:DUF1972 domain-containing protein [Chitinibacter sp. ZOR0017]|uniref:DUF1972 domain-containing protein n=1 Tax=Chitinibacter sp. ZOR0017 TaxID=1339254 RepID=UPI000645C2F8|nr:DUF1972 domain-containing protein [Chitinibacter sp. ZOR0017]